MNMLNLQEFEVIDTIQDEHSREEVNGMLKITVLGLISTILAGGLLALKFVAYDLEDESAAGGVFGMFDLIKDFIVIFMMLWYALK